jgi:hypothetical protein
VHDITTSFWEVTADGNRFRDNSKLLSTPSEEKDRVDRRIFAPYLQRIEVEEETGLPYCNFHREWRSSRELVTSVKV